MLLQIFFNCFSPRTFFIKSKEGDSVEVHPGIGFSPSADFFCNLLMFVTRNSFSTSAAPVYALIGYSYALMATVENSKDL